MSVRWHIYPDPQRLAAAATERILDHATRAIGERGSFLVVLAGGSTPRNIYAALATGDTDWRNWHVFFTDERCLRSGHPDRNDVMARAALLDHVPIPADQVFTIPAELGPREGARAYRATLADVGDFDLTLLGLGEDGHTASLFPGHTWGGESEAPDALAVSDAPKPPSERISLSAARLSRSAATMVMVTGAGKQEAVRRFYEHEDIPISAVTPRSGVDVLLDAAAAAAISDLEG